MSDKPKWYELETPQEVTSRRNRLQWYRQARRLQVSLPDWQNENGEIKRGKTVTLVVNDLKGVAGAVEIFQEILAILQEQAAQERGGQDGRKAG